MAGNIFAEAKGEIANIRLSNPQDYRPDVPLTINGQKIQVHYIDTGVPHTIIFVDELKKIDVARIGPMIRYHKKFQPRGTNANFVEQMKEDLVAVRTFERGVENETKACGTGAVASAIVSYLKANPDVQNKVKARMNVLTKSAETLEVTFDLDRRKASNVWLKGSAKFIAQGLYFG